MVVSAAENKEDVSQLIDGIVRRARAASRELAVTSTDKKNRALRAMAENIRANAGRIKTENARDLEAIDREPALLRGHTDERRCYVLLPSCSMGAARIRRSVFRSGWISASRLRRH